MRFWEIADARNPIANCAVWSLKFGVRRVQCEVWSVECEDFASSLAEKIKRLSREGHGRDRVSLNYRSFMFGKLPPPACPGLCYIYIYICIYGVVSAFKNSGSCTSKEWWTIQEGGHRRWGSQFSWLIYFLPSNCKYIYIIVYIYIYTKIQDDTPCVGFACSFDVLLRRTFCMLT